VRAEREMIGAEKGSEKIAVEIKSFLGASDLNDFEDALGQFMVYLFALNEIDKDRFLFLAMPETYYDRFFEDTFFTKMTKPYNVNIIVYNDNEPILTQWVK
jgi:XisH protein